MMLDTNRLRLIAYTPQQLLSLMDGPAAFEKATGYPAAAGLGDFLSSGEVSPTWLEKLRAATETVVWDHGFGLLERETVSVIGGLMFKGPPDATGMVEIGYGIVPTFQNREFATEAVAVCLEFAFQQPSVRLVRAHTLSTPNASTKVLTKCGFAFRGEVMDPEDGQVWRWERYQSTDDFPRG
jgi:[ribosomal protein S5]-alanine N-acetyltransferase